MRHHHAWPGWPHRRRARRRVSQASFGYAIASIAESTAGLPPPLRGQVIVLIQRIVALFRHHHGLAAEGVRGQGRAQ